MIKFKNVITCIFFLLKTKGVIIDFAHIMRCCESKVDSILLSLIVFVLKTVVNFSIFSENNFGKIKNKRD